MRVGISMTSALPVADVREGARYMIERARAAEAARLDSLFVGDHHAVPIPYYQNTPILARCLAEWGDRDAGALYLLPLWHPVLLAEQIGTLASIATGRFVLQCAIGPDDAQFPAMGVDKRERPSRFEECLDVMRRLWAGETVSHDGHFALRDARIAPCPPEPVEVWIGAAAAPALDRAARLGEAWLASPHLTPSQAADQLARYREACARHGRTPARVCIRRDVFVGANADEAKRVGGAIVDGGYRGFPPEATVVGDPHQVSDAFAALGEIGFTDVIVRNLVGEQSHAVVCIERLAEVREAVAG